MKILFVCCCLLLSSGAVFAQSPSGPRPLSAEEVKAVGRGRSFAGRSYRLRRSSKTVRKSDGALTYYSDETTEYLPSGDSRSVVRWGTERNPSMSTEIIKIGQKIYDLHPSGTWRESTLRIDPKPAPPVSQATTETAAEHFYLGKTSLKGRSSDLYESRFKLKTTRGGDDFLTNLIVRKWIAPDGSVLRIEENVETDAATVQRVFEYELDPNIKIEAPVKDE